MKNDLPESKPEYAQHLRDGGCGETQVNGSQHSQKVEHGLVEAALSLDDKQDGEISYERNQIHNNKRKANPDVHVF